MSDHNGSVWARDNALVAAGLMRYGEVGATTTVATASLGAADAFDGRLPELFSGFPRDVFDTSPPFPIACSPQAWAAATPLLLLRTLRRLDLDGRSATASLSAEGGELMGLGPDLAVREVLTPRSGGQPVMSPVLDVRVCTQVPCAPPSKVAPNTVYRMCCRLLPKYIDFGNGTSAAQAPAWSQSASIVPR